MPLYDFACSGCGRLSTLLLKYTDVPLCPTCGESSMERRLAPCAFTGFARSESEAPRLTVARPATSHAHHATCGCAPVASQAPCATEAAADQLIKKYLD